MIIIFVFILGGFLFVFVFYFFKRVLKIVEDGETSFVRIFVCFGL